MPPSGMNRGVWIGSFLDVRRGRGIRGGRRRLCRWRMNCWCGMRRSCRKLAVDGGEWRQAAERAVSPVAVPDCPGQGAADGAVQRKGVLATDDWLDESLGFAGTE